MLDTENVLRIDIVSDVVCPWCIIGFKQLQQALVDTEINAELHWQPFQLNPNMVSEGQDLREHVSEKYGATVEQSKETRVRISSIATSLDYAINFTDDSRIYNTFNAHKLLHWANETGAQHKLKLALFDAYFTNGIDISKTENLLTIIDSLGLDKEQAIAALASEVVSEEVNKLADFWVSQGISGVPAMIFNQQHLVTGAQGVENYTSILKQLTAKTS